ncbi:MAG: 3-oxoacyl-[acyl-carrier-protein] reductase [Oscillospiraceae bacterium]
MLNGKSALVTGGSRGIGRAICLELAKNGANVAINYFGSSDAAAEVKEECEKLGVKAIAIKADVSKEDECQDLISKACDAFGRIDILVNNAGITKDNLILRMSSQDFDSVLNTNLRGAFLCLKYVSKIMLRQKSGKILNISSIVGISGNAGQVNYSAAKAGIIGMTKSLAKELGSRSITVNAIAPGFIATDMTKNLPPEAISEISKNIPLKRMGEPQDIANAALFLLSDNSAYITGQVLNVDGGMLM